MAVPKLRFRFTLADSDGGGVYEYDPLHLMLQEAAYMERLTGQTVQEWQAGLQRGSALAKGALILLLKKRRGEATGDFSKFDIDIMAMQEDVLDEDGNVLTAEELKAMTEQAEAEARAPKDSANGQVKSSAKPKRTQASSPSA